MGVGCQASLRVDSKLGLTFKLYIKMLRLICVSVCLFAVAQGAPQAILPPGLDAAACPNFPFCGPTPLEVPKVPGAAAVIAAQQQVLDAERVLAGPAVPQVPGLAAHKAAELAVIGRQQQFAAGGVVGPSGNIGPSGLCGPSGCVAF